MALDILNRGPHRSVTDILLLFWAAKYYILVFFVVLNVTSFLWLSAQDRYYRSTMILGPVESVFQSADQTLYEAQESYSAVPVHTVKRQDTALDFQYFIKIMRSEKLASYMIDHMPEVLTYFKAEKAVLMPWQARYDFDRPEEEFAAYLTYILKQRIIVQPDGLTPFHRLHIDMANQVMAKRFTEALYRYTDMFMRQDALNAVHKRLDYLNQRLKQTRNSTVKKMLTAMIMQEESGLTILRSHSDFAARLIEAPYVQPYAIWPRPFLLAVVVCFISLILGTVLFGFTQTLRQRLKQE